MIGCTVQELGERMTAEEFAWWAVMFEQDQIGPVAQTRLLAHVAAGVRNNGHLKGPDGEKSVWTINHFIDGERWSPPAPPPTREGMAQAIKGWFAKFGF